jgi:hypothetical protein
MCDDTESTHAGASSNDPCLRPFEQHLFALFCLQATSTSRRKQAARPSRHGPTAPGCCRRSRKSTARSSPKQDVAVNLASHLGRGHTTTVAPKSMQTMHGQTENTHQS